MKKVLCNSNLTKYSDEFVTFSIEDCIKKGSLKIVSAMRKMKNEDIDALLLFNPGIKEIVLCVLARTVLRKKVFFFDANLKKPKTPIERIVFLTKGFMINQCNKFIVMHKDLSEYYRYYAIDKSKVEYVPFKSNCYEIRDTIEIEDGGYILSCGASHRDYDTLIKAVRETDIKVIIVLPNQAGAALHKSRLSEGDIPENVEIIRHDFSRNSWYDFLRKASIVVIPIDSDCIQPAGISVYLEAMSLGKPTIISKGPSTNGLIQDEAILVDRENPDQLKEAIESLERNRELRNFISEKGKEYALSLEGIDRLTRDLKKIIKKEFGQ